MKTEVPIAVVLVPAAGERLSAEGLRSWLDRPCPKGSWRDFFDAALEKGCPFDEALPQTQQVEG